MSTMTTPASEVIFITNKPKLRSHNKSRRGCLSCKARKVKCSEARPTCRACARRGDACVYDDSSRNAENTSQREAGQMTMTGSYICDEDVQEPDPSSTGTLWSSRDTTPNQLNWTDRDDMEVIQSCNFYNTFVVKDVAPAHAPFRRVEIPVDAWRYHIPKMLQHVWISLMKSMQANKAGVDPFSITEICQYRGSGLRELKQALPTVKNDPYGMVLSCVVTMMTTDLLTGGPWTTHLEAARRIMVMYGGFRRCFDQILPLRRLLFNYIIADTFSATMCNSRLINDSCLEMHAEYVEILDSADNDLFECSRPSPRQMIQAIVRVNLLRASWSHQTTNTDEEIQSTTRDLSDFIQRFDATTWAITASIHGRVLPAKADDYLNERDAIAMSTYASCYQSSTLLYFLLSCRTPLNPADKLRAQFASRNLSQQVRSLFDSATEDHEGPIHSQLWKLISWPILVGLYAGIGWDIGRDEVKDHLERIRKLSTLVGSTRIMDVTKFMYRVEAQRARCSAADWKWDDGFYTRCAFAL